MVLVQFGEPIQLERLMNILKNRCWDSEHIGNFGDNHVCAVLEIGVWLLGLGCREFSHDIYPPIVVRLAQVGEKINNVPCLILCGHIGVYFVSDRKTLNRHKRRRLWISRSTHL